MMTTYLSKNLKQTSSRGVTEYATLEPTFDAKTNKANLAIYAVHPAAASSRSRTALLWFRSATSKTWSEILYSQDRSIVFRQSASYAPVLFNVWFSKRIEDFVRKLTEYQGRLPNPAGAPSPPAVQPEPIPVFVSTDGNDRVAIANANANLRNYLASSNFIDNMRNFVDRCLTQVLNDVDQKGAFGSSVDKAKRGYEWVVSMLRALPEAVAFKAEQDPSLFPQSKRAGASKQETFQANASAIDFIELSSPEKTPEFVKSAIELSGLARTLSGMFMMAIANIDLKDSAGTFFMELVDRFAAYLENLVQEAVAAMSTPGECARRAVELNMLEAVTKGEFDSDLKSIDVLMRETYDQMVSVVSGSFDATKAHSPQVAELAKQAAIIYNNSKLEVNRLLVSAFNTYNHVHVLCATMLRMIRKLLQAYNAIPKKNQVVDSFDRRAKSFGSADVLLQELGYDIGSLIKSDADMLGQMYVLSRKLWDNFVLEDNQQNPVFLDRIAAETKIMSDAVAVFRGRDGQQDFATTIESTVKELESLVLIRYKSLAKIRPTYPGLNKDDVNKLERNNAFLDAIKPNSDPSGGPPLEKSLTKWFQATFLATNKSLLKLDDTGSALFTIVNLIQEPLFQHSNQVIARILLIDVFVQLRKDGGAYFKATSWKAWLVALLAGLALACLSTYIVSFLAPWWFLITITAPIISATSSWFTFGKVYVTEAGSVRISPDWNKTVSAKNPAGSAPSLLTFYRSEGRNKLAPYIASVGAMICAISGGIAGFGRHAIAWAWSRGWVRNPTLKTVLVYGSFALDRLSTIFSRAFVIFQTISTVSLLWTGQLAGASISSLISVAMQAADWISNTIAAQFPAVTTSSVIAGLTNLIGFAPSLGIANILTWLTAYRFGPNALSWAARGLADYVLSWFSYSLPTFSSPWTAWIVRATLSLSLALYYGSPRELILYVG
jgi:hypothetical protein